MCNRAVPAGAAPVRGRFLAAFLAFLLALGGIAAVGRAAAAEDASDDALVRSLGVSDPVERSRALTRLVEERKHPRSLAFASAALKDPNWYNRMNAARLLGEMRDPGAVPALEGALRDDKWNVREIAAEAIGKIGGERGVEALLAAIRSPFPDVRVRASNLLTLVKFPGATAPMKKGLTDADPAVRLASALAIQNTDPAETGPLAALLEDRDPSIREKAALFLGRLKSSN